MGDLKRIPENKIWIRKENKCEGCRGVDRSEIKMHRFGNVRDNDKKEKKDIGGKRRGKTIASGKKNKEK